MRMFAVPRVTIKCKIESAIVIMQRSDRPFIFEFNNGE